MVATPIGNLRDITLRALEILKRVDVVAAEDTRTTSGLLKHFDISVRLMSLHQHNETQKSAAVLSLLAEGKNVALVSDAGTPAISDPGAMLIQAARDAGYHVVPIPGPSAVVTALSASGLTDTGFLFYGFLPAKSAARKKILASLKDLPFSLVFYEAPHRIAAFTHDLAEIMGMDRTVVFARELTKMFETIHSCSMGEALAWIPAQQRGEFVVIVKGAKQEERTGVSEAGARMLEILLPMLPLNQAVKAAVQISGESRNELYELALKLKSASV